MESEVHGPGEVKFTDIVALRTTMSLNLTSPGPGLQTPRLPKHLSLPGQILSLLEPLAFLILTNNNNNNNLYYYKKAKLPPKYLSGADFGGEMLQILINKLKTV